MQKKVNGTNNKHPNTKLSNNYTQILKWK